MRRLVAIQLAVLLMAGCASRPTEPVPNGNPGNRAGSREQLSPEIQELGREAENEALIEWQVGRMAAVCNEVAAQTQSPAARREALRIKAAYATSSYAIAARNSSLMQVLNLLAMSSLTHLVWVDEGFAAAAFGPHAKAFQDAVGEIRGRVRGHALSHLSANEVQAAEATALAWRKEHPGPVVVELIRFEAFADEVANSVSARSDLGGLFGRISASTRNVEMLGERALFLATRMPRLTEWHAEAAAANLLMQPQLADSLASVRLVAEAQEGLLNRVDRFDSRLATLPADLADRFASQPNLKAALDRLEQAGRDLKKLDASLAALERSVTTLASELGQLNAVSRPAALRQLIDQSEDRLASKARSLFWMMISGVAGLLVLHAVLQRSIGRPHRP